MRVDHVGVMCHMYNDMEMSIGGRFNIQKINTPIRVVLVSFDLVDGYG